MTIAYDGVLDGGLPYRVAGTGPPLIILPGLTGDNADPTGSDRRAQLRAFRSLTSRFTVYLINRRPGLRTDVTLGDLADDYADVIARRFTAPVPVIGVSTGGSIAQLLAAGHPHLVRRLVLVASAHRLAASGRRTQRTLARYTRIGRPRRAWAATGPALAGSVAGRWVCTALMWLFGARMNPADPADLLTTIAAEDAFDAWPELPRITAPTLIVGGAGDGFYTAGLFRATARRIPDARLLLYPSKGHLATVACGATGRAILQFLTTNEAGTSCVSTAATENRKRAGRYGMPGPPGGETAARH